MNKRNITTVNSVTKTRLIQHTPTVCQTWMYHNKLEHHNKQVKVC